MRIPYARYRPTRTPDGQGGWTPTSLGAANTLYGAVSYQESETEMSVKISSDVQETDIIVIGGAQYEVLQIVRQDGTDSKMLSLEKIERPI